MKIGQKFIVIRYGNNIINNCIDEHKSVIEKNGFCWFGKIGTIPSQKVLDAVLKEEEPTLILYSKNHAYECKFNEVLRAEKPKDGYPDYYKEYLYDCLIFPNSYYKLLSITEVDIKELNKYVIVSSRNNLLATLNSSMSSFFFAENPNKKVMDGVTIQKKNKKPIDTNNEPCKYLKNGICNNKGFVNYLYICERPKNCSAKK